MKILTPTDEGYIHDGTDYSDEILDIFFAWLSFKCMFKTADIPDGGSCCVTYGYEPSIEIFMKTDYIDELNHSYCRSVFGYMYNLCKLHKDQSIPSW